MNAFISEAKNKLPHELSDPSFEGILDQPQVKQRILNVLHEDFSQLTPQIMQKFHKNLRRIIRRYEHQMKKHEKKNVVDGPIRLYYTTMGTIGVMRSWNGIIRTTVRGKWGKELQQHLRDIYKDSKPNSSDSSHQTNQSLSIG